MPTSANTDAATHLNATSGVAPAGQAGPAGAAGVPDELLQQAARLHGDLIRQVTSVVAVQPAVLTPLITSLLARGHVLLEGIPGIGKTLLARALGTSLDCGFRRIQFTNDLMPTDILGTSVWKAQAERFVFVEGPLFTNLVLADEINRTSPRTLSCLLEAMEEGNVTIEGERRQLGEPFLVLATRNPIEFHGTFPIPEAALDRFLIRVELDYPEENDELALYRGEDAGAKLRQLQPIVQLKELLEVMAAVDRVAVSEPVARYAYGVVQATRSHGDSMLGASPRAALAWLRAARAWALLQGRSYVLPDDLQCLAQPVLAHRVFVHGGGSGGPIVAQALAHTPVEL